jgi:hypothetical protein
MYPQAELSRLASTREALSRRMGRNRRQCAADMSQVMAPLEWVDRVLAIWRKISTPVLLTALPLGILLKRAMFPKPRILGKLVQWAPVLFGALRSIADLRRRPIQD